MLHGGPAAPGEAAPLARGLAGPFRVAEPWQRGSGDKPLTVAAHVEDLHGLITEGPCGPAPAIVGESWGAMLALAYAAAHPETAGPLVIVGCGTFDAISRAHMRETLDERTGPELRQALQRLEGECPEPVERLPRKYQMMRALYDFDPVGEDPSSESEAPPFDARAHAETWNDMLRLQGQGIYPTAFRAIRSPVLMLHGAYDPHPGAMIRASLVPFIPHLEYREWERCGHSPWRERHVREEFFTFLRDWIAAHIGISSISRPRSRSTA